MSVVDFLFLVEILKFINDDIFDLGEESSKEKVVTKVKPKEDVEEESILEFDNVPVIECMEDTHTFHGTYL